MNILPSVINGGLTSLHLLVRGKDAAQKVRLPPFRFPLWTLALLITLCLMGGIVRLAAIDYAPYSADEVRGFARASGYSGIEIEKLFGSGHPLQAGQIVQQYQLPNGDRTVSDALKAFQNNPEHPPLFYLLMRFALQWGQNSLAGRVLNAILGIVALPVIYWLGWELFQRHLTAGLATALVAVAPYAVYLSREARQYSLWLVAIALSGALLLRVVRTGGRSLWWAYGASLLVGIYTHWFFGLIWCSHALYLALLRCPRDRWWGWGVASLGAGAGLVPWLVTAHWSRLSETTAVIDSQNFSLLMRLKLLLIEISKTFVAWDFEPSLKTPWLYVFLAIAIASFVSLSRHTGLPVWGFVVVLTAPTTLVLLGADFLKGGARSLNGRYALACYLAISLALAGGGVALWNAHRRGLQRWFGVGVLSMVLLISGTSSGLLVPTISLWSSSQRASHMAGQLLRQHPLATEAAMPIVFTDSHFSLLLSLAHEIPPQYLLWQLPKTDRPHQDAEALYKTIRSPVQRPIFLYRPSQQLLDQVQTWPEVNPRQLVAKENRGLFEVLWQLST